MSSDRSPGAADAAPPPAPALAEEDGQPKDGSPRESWYERLLHRFHAKARDTLRHDLEDALAETVAPGEDTFSPLERSMLKNVLGLHKVRVDDVMVPRADIVAAPAESTLGDILKLFRTAGHSRLPVYGETLDDPKGMVHIRDFLDHIAARAEAGRPRIAREAAQPATAPDLPTSEAARRPRRARTARVPDLGGVDLSITLASTKILRPVLFVPPSMPAIDLLIRMQATRTHMALVIDEYGGTDGLISIENLIEMVVGDIEDEHDVAEGHLVVRVEGEAAVFLADARASLPEVSQATGVDLAAAIGEMAEEVDTLGGLIVTMAGRVPSRGELLTGPGELEFEVLDADPRRLKRLRIHHRPGRLTADEAPLALPPPAKALPPPQTAGTPAG